MAKVTELSLEYLATLPTSHGNSTLIACDLEGGA